MIKRLIQWKLAWHSRRILAKYRPTIVAVTGSVGKTSSRNAIAAVLSSKFRVRCPEENYNNEFGVPLTIIGAKSPGSSFLGWTRVLLKAAGLWLLPRSRRNAYPNLLVLEYGLTRPGDIAHLCDLARPDVGVLTTITPVHVEAFGTIDKLIEEKGEIVKAVAVDGLVVMNGDDANVATTMGMRAQDRHGNATPIVTYGFGESCDVRAENYRVETNPVSIAFDLVMGEERVPVVLNDLLGRGQAYAALSAAAVGKHFGLTINEIAEGLERFHPQAGRMRPIRGIKQTLILDDSYNAAPASMAAALEVLRCFEVPESSRRIAVLGRMGELGRYSVDEHRLLGLRTAEVADLLVCVGEEARDIRRGAIEAGMDENAIQYFLNSTEAGRWLDFNVKSGDVVLVKGSQSARMEKVVKDLMTEPLRASELLVRQYGKWLKE